MRIPKKYWRLFYFVLPVFFILYYLDKILTVVDQFVMPTNDEICKTFPSSLSKYFNIFTFSLNLM